MITVDVDGLAPLERALDQGAATSQQRVIESLWGLAHDIAAAARSRVQTQRATDRPGPSRLAESISVELRPAGADVAAAAPHAVFVEFGTSNMPAEPFLGPSFDEQLGQIANALRAGPRL